ncbi:hypothetical protein Pisl_1374 [Pyrobaculum islandicum DSM 4184]|uniref:Uncharacterized protein n=1 Tax=Pyrobaculum islandicum (strain DSM 4184 / JCM 9189 / GEO3) TaxID=384616 RepID=A1RUA4_PYRIL|nr:hypothetical protein [Pyrobaculum islandicum]ABL88536.1 hypothetical protein Pisl_1374 [Pyrobaculum islandicum DSM 4184]
MDRKKIAGLATIPAAVAIALILATNSLYLPVKVVPKIPITYSVLPNGTVIPGIHYVGNEKEARVILTYPNGSMLEFDLSRPEEFMRLYKAAPYYFIESKKEKVLPIGGGVIKGWVKIEKGNKAVRLTLLYFPEGPRQ